MSPVTPGARFALTVSTIALLFALLGAALAWRVYANEREHAVDETERLAESAALNADRFLADRLSILTAISFAPPVRAGDVPAKTAYFISFDPAQIGLGGGVGWVDGTGWIQAFTGVDPAMLPIDVSQSEHAQMALQSQAPSVGVAFVDERSGLPVLPFAVPSYDVNGVFSGLVVGSSRLNLMEAAAKERRFGTDDLYIIDRGGNIVIGPEPVTELVNVGSDPLHSSITPGSAGVLEDATGIAGAEHMVVAYASVPAHGWTILVERSEDELYGDARRVFWFEVIGLTLVCLAVTVGAISIGRRINRESAKTAKALTELGVRESRLRALTEATTQVNWTVDTAGVLVEPARRWSALTGIPADQVDQESWLPYVHPDDRAPGDAAWNAGIATGQMIEFEQRVTRLDGGERNYLVRAVPVRDAAGGITEWIGVDIDVTMQRQAERSMRDSADRLALALEAGQLTAWDWDVQNDRIVWSEGVSAAPGPRPQSIAQFYERIHPDDRDRIRETIQRSLAERIPYEIEYRTIEPDDTTCWRYERGDAFHDGAGRALRVIGVDVDVTDRKARELFEQDFIASVAHDIKNPLAAVKAQAQLLRRRVKSGRADMESIDGVLSLLDAGLTRMNRRIEELADVARLRAGRELELRRMPVNLGALVRQLIESYRQTTEAHSFVLDVPEPDLTADVDEGRIERVIDNLISNAVKYSPDGGEIRIALVRDAGEPGYARLTVVDHGIGIPATDLPHIFDRYQRAGNTAVITGTGIGLAGARQIVEQHGGRIEVESREGVGSAFTVLLPLTESALLARGEEVSGLAETNIEMVAHQASVAGAREADNDSGAPDLANQP